MWTSECHVRFISVSGEILNSSNLVWNFAFYCISEVLITKINDAIQNDYVEVGLKVMWARIAIFVTKGWLSYKLYQLYISLLYIRLNNLF